MVLTFCVFVVLVIEIFGVDAARNLTQVGLEAEEGERREVCVEVLGCFPETDPNNKPVDNTDKFFAWVSETIDTQFWRSTREGVGTEFRFWKPGSTQAEVMDNFNFHVHITKDSGYDPHLNTYFIIHGYHGGNAVWALTMKDALRAKEECNVFIVDWSEGDGILYGTALQNIWVVGAETGRFIERIVDLTGMKPRQVHIIGHSLGAHTAGLAGKWVKNRLGRLVGRITGLDPAGPDFYDVVPGERLDKDDAAFVDVIHTNWATNSLAGLGLQKPIGHFDFYPNGGEEQPGCPTASEADLSIGTEILEYINPTYKLIVTVVGDDKSIDDAFGELACAHGRAYDYFIESIQNKNCQFLSDECASWDDYIAHKCLPGRFHMRVPMGFYAKKFKKNIDRSAPSKTFYVSTKATSPYCISEQEQLAHVLATYDFSSMELPTS